MPGIGQRLEPTPCSGSHQNKCDRFPMTPSRIKVMQNK